MVKIAVFAPMPSASVRIAIAVKPGLLAIIRSAYRINYDSTLKKGKGYGQKDQAGLCKPNPMENPAEFGKVEGADGILTIRGGGNVRGWNGIRYKSGLSAKNVGAKKLSMNVATIPPGGVAYAHIHVDFEVMLYILSGRGAA